MDPLDHYRGHVGFPQMPIPLECCELCAGTDLKVIRDTVVVRGAARAPIRVAACSYCGLLFQLDRFDAESYARYYSERYRMTISGAAEPDESFMQDQLHRGEQLFQNLRGCLPPQGRLLDVGCGAGGLLVAFARNGWDAQGLDPDHRAVALGRRRFGLNLSAGVAEEMSVPDEGLDLILITGSLEHVADLNGVVSRCAQALCNGGLLLLEGWGMAQARLTGGFGHNQKRYFTATSFFHLFQRHRIELEFITADPLCGPSRPGSIFAMGRVGPRRADLAVASVSQLALPDGPLTHEELNCLGIH